MIFAATDRMIAEELDPAEREELRAIVRSPVMLKAFRLVRSEMEAKHERIAKSDLSQMAGIHEAVKLQGLSAGLGRAIQIFEELVEQEKKE